MIFMRKLDAVLLSALLLYDYSAQSLVDSDILSLGNSVMERVGLQENNFAEDELADPLFLHASNENVITAENTKLNHYTSSATVKQNISYHALAKINAAGANVAAESHYNVVNAPVGISTRGSLAVDIANSDTLLSTPDEQTTVSLSAGSVSASV